MDNRMYEKLKENLCGELETIIERGDISGSKLDMVDKMVHTLKNIDKVMEGEYSHRGSYGEYSNEGSYRGSYDGGSYRGSYDGGSYRGSYDGDGSYRGRGMHYVGGHYSHAGGRREVYDMIEEIMSDGKISAEDRRILKKAQDALSD